MRVWLIEFCLSPPFERSNQWGVIVHLEISDEPFNSGARLWARQFQGMDWMQDPPISEVRLGDPTSVDWESAKSLLDKLCNAQLQIAPCGNFGIHPSTFRLKIQSGTNSCQLSWADEPPPEWAALAEVAQTLEMWGNEYACKA